MPGWWPSQPQIFILLPLSSRVIDRLLIKPFPLTDLIWRENNKKAALAIYFKMRLKNSIFHLG
jgi:hypothetical protein